MNEPICRFCHEKIEHNIVPTENGCHPRCAESRNAAAIAVERNMLAIDALPEAQQKHIFACCVRLRELVCEFGPDIRYALSLTGAEIASGTIDITPVESAPQIYVPDNALIVKH